MPHEGTVLQPLIATGDSVIAGVVCGHCSKVCGRLRPENSCFDPKKNRGYAEMKKRAKRADRVGNEEAYSGRSTKEPILPTTAKPSRPTVGGARTVALLAHGGTPVSDPQMRLHGHRDTPLGRP